MGPAIRVVAEKPCRILLTGRSTMGKTTLAVDIIMTQILPHVQRCFAACPSWYAQATLKPLRDVPDAFPRQRVFTRVDDSVFELIYRTLVKRPCPTLLFVDDAAAEAATNKGNKGSFSRLCTTSPHLQLYIVGCFQRLTSASPSLRDNTEGIISFIPSRMEDVGYIVSEFNAFPARAKSKHLIMDILQQCWDKERFAFIWREGFTGRMHYYCGLNQEVTLSGG